MNGLLQLRSKVGFVAAVVVIGAVWRLWLGSQYAGWEESDYGNLAMIRGVLDGGFRHYDMNHMPGYYGLAAVFMWLLDDAQLAARLVSLVGGLVALGIAVGLADDLWGRTVAVVCALVLMFQPEFALYSASSLREPLYCAFVMGCLAGALHNRWGWVGFAAAAAFLVRFDAMFVLPPVFAFSLWGRGALSWCKALGPLVVAVMGWAIYCQIDHGTWVFWSHSVAVNLDTGMGAEQVTAIGWGLAGLRVVGGLLFELLPSRIGWGIAFGLLWALLGLRRFGMEVPRVWSLLGLMMLGFWASVGFVGQHSPEHNLYWKWLAPVVPVVVPLGVVGLMRLARLIGKVAGSGAKGLFLLVVIGQALLGHVQETQRQVQLSQVLYAPQRDLGVWFEDEVDSGSVLLVDNIPACWINRRSHERRMISWFDVPVEGGDGLAFASWLRHNEVAWVLWFRESWTQAPVVAPFLREGGVWTKGGLRLRETNREDEYGWILFAVEPQPGRDPLEQKP